MGRCVTALKEWTGKARATIIYDSTVDEFTDDGLFAKVKGKRNIALIGFTTDGDVFGGFYSVAVTKQDEDFYDPSMFAFSFEAHGRCETPQRFVVYEWLDMNANVSFRKNDSYGFVRFGVNRSGCFILGDERSNSFCWDVSDAFKGLDHTTLTGKNCTYNQGPYHHYTRLVAVQIE